ncbi:MAG TPA: hypothetical protein VLX28_01425, partial [Thermoanaerobaculia bacterium]|nr:hypothetical protein [Thermoanaerobaculia bacterium]
QGLSQDEVAWIEPENVLFAVMPEVRGGPERRVDMDRGEIGRRLFESRELTAQRKIDADLCHTVQRDRWFDLELSLGEITKDVRFREDQ